MSHSQGRIPDITLSGQRNVRHTIRATFCMPHSQGMIPYTKLSGKNTVRQNTVERAICKSYTLYTLTWREGLRLLAAGSGAVLVSDSSIIGVEYWLQSNPSAYNNIYILLRG